MYRISQLAALAGVSRTTLLYYEKIGLISSERQSNGYRMYHEQDLQRLRLIQRLQAGGLTLAECRDGLAHGLDKPRLRERLDELDRDIAARQQARQLLAGLLGEHSLKDWHQQLTHEAPLAHHQWLLAQGFTEKEALHLTWLSKDMNTHEQYMNDFMRVFSGLERWGPGSEHDTLKALHGLPHIPQRILEIGCGKGIATQVLAQHCAAQIIACDNDQPALDALDSILAAAGWQSRVSTLCADMQALPPSLGVFDLIWSEGSAYIMGVEQALRSWRSFLSEQGVLVLSDLVWLVDSPSADARAFWANDYPDMTQVHTRLEQMMMAGYRVLEHFTLSCTAWDAYRLPLQQRVDELAAEMPDSVALDDIRRELEVYREHLGEFGYQMFILQAC